VYQSVKKEFDLPELIASSFRRNVLLQGVPLLDLVGKQFSLQGVEFEGVEEAAPCYWMNEACAEGVHEFLKGQGGLRARITSGGELTRGSGILSLLP
jgi:MOSC domain-containing protein YiiM